MKSSSSSSNMNILGNSIGSRATNCLRWTSDGRALLVGDSFGVVTVVNIMESHALPRAGDDSRLEVLLLQLMKSGRVHDNDDDGGSSGSNTDENDIGLHTVCLKVNDEFLKWCKEAGNDLITPHPEFGFPGLKDGDNWCVCATWFAKAVEAGKECKIYLKKTNEKTLKIIPLEILKKHAIDLS